MTTKRGREVLIGNDLTRSDNKKQKSCDEETADGLTGLLWPFTLCFFGTPFYNSIGALTVVFLLLLSTSRALD